MKRIFYPLIAFSIIYSNPASAIVNVENMRVEPTSKTKRFESKLALDIDGDNGNTQKIKAGAGARAQWYEETGTRFIVINYEYGESADVKDTDKTFFHFRNIWHRTETYSWEAFTQFESNEFTRLKLRALAGGGIRWPVLHNDSTAVYIGLGVLRSKEKLDSAPLVTDAGTTYNNRLSTYMVYKHTISKHSRLTNTLYYQPDLSEASDYRMLEQFGLQMDITENLSFRLSLDIAHDSYPPQQIKQTDTGYSAGFDYHF